MADYPNSIPEELPPLDDEGNALRLVRKYSDELRFAEGIGWLRWTGTHLQPVSDDWVIGYVSLRDTFDEDLAATDDREEGARIVSHRARSASHGRRTAAVKTALANPEIRINASDLDANADVLNTPGGLVDLKTGEIRPTTIGDLVTKVTAVAPKGGCPRFLAFLESVQPDADMRDHLQRLAGYFLTGKTGEHKLPFFYGFGANGKTTFAETLLGAMGSYARSAMPGLVVARRGERAHDEAVAMLHGLRLVVSSESEQNGELDVETVKRLTGGDQVTARHLYRAPFSFAPTHKLLLMSNHKPAVATQDHGTWRRLLLEPWPVTIPTEAIDTGLGDALRAEWGGILRWAVEGAVKWYRDGLAIPIDVVTATEAYRIEEDVLGSFLADHPLPFEGIKATLLYETYSEWCRLRGHRAMSATKLGKRLAERPDCFKVRRETGVHWCAVDAQKPATEGNEGLMKSSETSLGFAGISYSTLRNRPQPFMTLQEPDPPAPICARATCKAPGTMTDLETTRPLCAAHWTEMGYRPASDLARSST